MQRIMPELYTKRRMQNFISGIREIHKALVLHCDVNPRNMMVVENDPERAVWLDFDRAQTYYADNLSQRQKSFIKMEELNVSQFAEGLVSHSRGKVYENSESLDANLLCCDRDAIINKGKYMTPSCTTAPKKSKEQRTARTGVFWIINRHRCVNGARSFGSWDYHKWPKKWGISIEAGISEEFSSWLSRLHEPYGAESCIVQRWYWLSNTVIKWVLSHLSYGYGG